MRAIGAIHAKKFPTRKFNRLQGFDYSSAGAYFVTICTENRKRILSEIVRTDKNMVGGGAHDVPQIQLTQIGRVIEKYLLSSQKIPGIKIDQFVIMLDHIHAIICIFPENSTERMNGTSRAPSPTNERLPHIVSTFKRLCNKEIGENVFQRSYSDHVIRDKEDYETRRRYIYENPLRWIIKNK